MDSVHLLHLNPLRLAVRGQVIRGKSVVVLQSEVQLSIWRLAVESLGGVWLTKEDYLGGREADILVSNRWLMRKEISTYLETELLKKLLSLDE